MHGSGSKSQMLTTLCADAPKHDGSSRVAIARGQANIADDSRPARVYIACQVLRPTNMSPAGWGHSLWPIERVWVVPLSLWRTSSGFAILKQPVLASRCWSGVIAASLVPRPWCAHCALLARDIRGGFRARPVPSTARVTTRAGHPTRQVAWPVPVGVVYTCLPSLPSIGN